MGPMAVWWSVRKKEWWRLQSGGNQSRANSLLNREIYRELFVFRRGWKAKSAGF
jgi:hypothetical protein